jgi:glycosyltransferase involved in cell wall biosynthesis
MDALMTKPKAGLDAIGESHLSMPAKPQEKPKILLYGDYCCATGFAQVLGNIARELHATGKYDLDVLAINYSGDPKDDKKWPGNVWPAMPGAMMQAGAYGDVYGRQRLLDLMGSGKYDAVYMIQDTFVIQPIMEEIQKTQAALKERGMKTFKTVFYFPVDAKLKPEWAETVAGADFPVVYTKFGEEEVLRHQPDLKDRLRVIYHGNNPQDFFPIQDRQDVENFKEQFFNGKAKDRFLIVNVNRNQPRKDIARSLMILKELWDRGRRPLLYLHMQYDDSGGNIFTMANQLGLGKEYEFFLPSPKIFTANQGMPIEAVNRIYNAADMVLSTTLGEGWGLSITEAMATKTPIVAPGNTSLNEMMANNRGKLIPSGADPSMFVINQMDNDRLRPLADVKAAADIIEGIMDQKDMPNVEAAYQWVRELDWSKICRQWIQVVEEALQASREENEKPAEQFMNRAQRRKLERKKKGGK